MNKLSFKISTLLAVAVLFAACSNDETLTPETDGQVDISTRVNAGNEATAEGTLDVIEPAPMCALNPRIESPT